MGGDAGPSPPEAQSVPLPPFLRSRSRPPPTPTDPQPNIWISIAPSPNEWPHDSALRQSHRRACLTAPRPADTVWRGMGPEGKDKWRSDGAAAQPPVQYWKFRLRCAPGRWTETQIRGLDQSWSYIDP